MCVTAITNGLFNSSIEVTIFQEFADDLSVTIADGRNLIRVDVDIV
jgi:hypothetical protein